MKITARLGETDIVLTEDELASWQNAQLDAAKYCHENMERKISVLYPFWFVMAAYFFGVMLGVFSS